jgi:hypothetical protein
LWEIHQIWQGISALKSNISVADIRNRNRNKNIAYGATTGNNVPRTKSVFMYIEAPTPSAQVKIELLSIAKIYCFRLNDFFLLVEGTMQNKHVEALLIISNMLYMIRKLLRSALSYGRNKNWFFHDISSVKSAKFLERSFWDSNPQPLPDVKLLHRLTLLYLSVAATYVNVYCNSRYLFLTKIYVLIHIVVYYFCVMKLMLLKINRFY